jgi:hypothetical protein
MLDVPLGPGSFGLHFRASLSNRSIEAPGYLSSSELQAAIGDPAASPFFAAFTLTDFRLAAFSAKAM